MSAGALAAARVSVLVAESADPERFRRGRAYAKQGAVVAVEHGPGRVAGVVQGSRREPYAVAVVFHRVGAGAEQLDLVATCTCPDDVDVCKHAVAVLLEFADRVAADPQVWEVTRAGATDWSARASGHRRAGPEAAAGLPVPAEFAPDPGPVEPAGPDPFEEFFAAPRPPAHEVTPLRPLGRLSPRPPRTELDAMAADALEAAHRALRALFG